MSGGLEEQRPPVPSPDEPGASRLLGLICQPPATVEASAASVIDELDVLKPTCQERASIASALLALLSDRGFGRVEVKDRVLRHEVVEALLRLGYPSALQLEPADVAALRVRAPARARLRPIHVVAFGVAACAAALVGASGGVPRPPREPSAVETAAPRMAPDDEDGHHPEGEPCRHDDHSRMAIPVASRVAELRRAGSLVVALAVAEACVVGFETPGPCVEELLRLPLDSGDPERALYRRRQWVLLADEPGAVVRSRARDLLINDFAREASLVPPTNPLVSQVMIKAIEEWEILALEGKGTALAERVSGCTELPGQNGSICRSFLARAEALKARAR